MAPKKYLKRKKKKSERVDPDSLTAVTGAWSLRSESKSAIGSDTGNDHLTPVALGTPEASDGSDDIGKDKDQENCNDETGDVEEFKDYAFLADLAIAYHVIYVMCSRDARIMFQDPAQIARRVSLNREDIKKRERMRAKLEEQARTALQEAPYKYHNAMKWLATNYTEGFSKREEKVRSACLNIAEQEEAPYLPRKSRAHTSLLEEDQDACSLLKSWLGHTFDYYWKVGRLLCSLQVLWPCLLVTGCCVVAIHVVDSEGLSDEEYDISQRSQGEWSAVLSKPSIDLGSETHEMLALVLGFLLAFQAQEAADRYVTADATFQKMCASLQEAALHSFSNLKNTKVTRAAKVHWELARSLHLLLLVASRDLQTGSLKGRRLTSKETDKTLGLLDGFVPEQASAIASTTGMARVYMSFEWVRMILDCAADKKWMDPDSAANKALECLDNFLEQWKEAHILAHAGEPALFHGLMSLFLYIFCCTLPFPLAASLGVWCFPAAITLAVAFFSLKVASDKMMEPFGFDDGTDVDVEKYCKEFWGIMQEMVVCVGWTPQRQKPIPWGCNKIKREVDPGEKMNGPPGEHELSCIIAESLGEKFAIKEEQVQEACRRMSARQSM